MRNKAPLALMEQAVMVLVFALAAALCLRVFVWADGHSRDNAARDMALIHAQNTAQTLKGCRGDYAAVAELCGGTWDGAAWVILRGGENDPCRLEITPGEPRVEHLGEAVVTAYDASGRLLAQLPVSWQEVGGHG